MIAVGSHSPMAAARKPITAQRMDGLLDSWKEIAVFLNRGVRTVQRWEREEGLPVHRHNHSKRGTVSALTSEITAWLNARSNGNSHPISNAPRHIFSLNQTGCYSGVSRPVQKHRSLGDYGPSLWQQSGDERELAERCAAARARAQHARKLLEFVSEKRNQQMSEIKCLITAATRTLALLDRVSTARRSRSSTQYMV
jgi:hypothetical protein